MKNEIFNKSNTHMVLEFASIGNLIFSIGASCITEQMIMSTSTGCRILTDDPQFSFTIKEANKYIDILNNTTMSLEDKESISSMFDSENSFYQMMFHIDEFIINLEPDIIWTSNPSKLHELLSSTLPQSKLFDYYNSGRVMNMSTVLNSKTLISNNYYNRLEDVSNTNPINLALLESKILAEFITNLEKSERNTAVYTVYVNSKLNKAKQLLMEGQESNEVTL